MAEELNEETSLEESIENADSQNGEEGSKDNGSEDDNTELTVEDYKALEQKNKELFARAKKAEGFELQNGKWVKKTITTKPLTKTNETQPGLTKEEAILYAKGFTEEEVALAQKIALINGVSPLKAVEDEIFKAKYDARLKKEKSEKASLSPSGGSRVKMDKQIEEMTREEHEAYAKKVIAEIA